VSIPSTHANSNVANRPAVRKRLRRRPRKPVTIDTILSKLAKVTQVENGQWTACCPAHTDTNPSLSIGQDADGKILFHCHSGCDVEDILPKLGLEWSDICATRPSPGAKGLVPAAETRQTYNPQPTATLAEPTFENCADASKDWTALAQQAIKRLKPRDLDRLSTELNVPKWALEAIHIGIMPTRDGEAYTFPEFDGRGQITGISLRFSAGKKKCIGKSQRGLTLPKNWHHGDGPILIVEGASDTAALVAMGLSAVGRPSAKGGVEQLLQLLAPLREDRQIIVMGEFDPKPDGTWPGLEGAKHVAQALADGLGRNVTTSLPPNRAKDIREWRTK